MEAEDKPTRRRRVLRSIGAVTLAVTAAALSTSVAVAQDGAAAVQAQPPATPADAVQADTKAAAPTAQPGRQHGRVSFYGRRFAQRATASGEPFDPEGLTMAHRSLPFGSTVKVTNLRNRRSVIVRVTDRGPHLRSRIADVSLGAARTLGMLRHGVIEARLEILALGDDEKVATAR